MPDLPEETEDYIHRFNDNAWFAGLNPFDPIFVSLVQAGRVKKPFVYNCGVHDKQLSFSIVVPERPESLSIRIKITTDFDQCSVKFPSVYLKALG